MLRGSAQCSPTEGNRHKTGERGSDEAWGLIIRQHGTQVHLFKKPHFHILKCFLTWGLALFLSVPFSVFPAPLLEVAVPFRIIGNKRKAKEF